jgi:tetratricopeptide (TPR) repeat protein
VISLPPPVPAGEETPAAQEGTGAPWPPPEEEEDLAASLPLEETGAAEAPGEPAQAISFGEIAFEEERAPEPSAPETGFAPPPGKGFEPGAPAEAPVEGSDDELESLFGPTSPPPAPAPPAGTSAPSFQVRRPSGKVFGPFGEDEILEMLGKGELLGNEDVAPEGGDAWSSIGSIPRFAPAVRRLKEAPVVAQAVPARGSARIPEPFKPKMESGLKERVRGIAGRRALVVVGAVLLVGVVAAGVAGAFTRHGPFFWKALRTRTSGAAVTRLVDDGKAALAQDAFAGDRRALDLAEQALRADASDPRARSLLGAAVSALSRRGAEAPVARARQMAAELVAREPRLPEALAAQLAAALAGGESTLPSSTALEKVPAGELDEEALFLLATAAADRGDAARAAGFLDRYEARRPGSARASRARAQLAARRGDAAAARGLLEVAHQREPGHAAIALELAALLEASGDPGAEAALRALAGKDRASALGPAELARVHLLLAGLAGRKPAGEARDREVEAELAAAVEAHPRGTRARSDLARLLLARGDVEGAVRVLEPAAPPGDVDYLRLQVRALVLANRLTEAQAAVDGAVARAADDPRLLVLKAWVEEQSGRSPEARKLYESAVARAPNDWRAQVALGRLAIRQGDVARAASAVQLAIDKAPDEAEALVGLGELRMAQGDVPAAADAFRRASEARPDDAGALLGLARVALARGDAAAAGPLAARAARLDPRFLDAQLLQAELSWKAGDAEGARKALAAAVAIDPKSAVARARLGALDLEQGRVDDALRELDQATNIDAGLAEAQYWLGRALLAKGDGAQALERLRRATELRPDVAAHHVHLGIAQERTGRVADAADSYRTAVARDPRSVEGYERLALLLSAQGDCKEAVAQLQKALQVAPRAERLRVEMADCQVRLGRHADAVAQYRKALQGDPTLVGAYYKIARAIHETQGLRAAMPWYERASVEDRDNAMPWLYLGYAYKERGQKSRAVQAFRTYLAKRPDADDRKDVEREIEDLGG